MQRVSIVGPRLPAEAGEANGPGLSSLATGRSLTAIDSDDLTLWAPSRLEDLTGLMPGTVVEPLHAGLSTAVKIRGFAVTRLHYGGMPDVQRMFSRDLLTVDRIEVMRGPAAALLGITSPGGAVHYQGKRPTALQRADLALTVGNQDHVRATVDASGPVGQPGAALRYRLIGAAEDGDQSWASLPRRRQTAMLVLERAYDKGVIGIDLQAHRNDTPFSFGTVITNAGAPGSPAVPARVAWDRLFVLEGGAPATRHYRQTQAYWRHAFDNGAEVHATLSAARVKRDETLMGYWTLVSPDAVSSYYTRYQDRYQQRSGRLEFRLPLSVAGWRHETRLGMDGYRQHFRFDGVQHIGALTTSVADPDFSGLDPSSLELWPRFNEERISEEAAWLADRARVNDWLEIAAAVRRQRYTIDADRVGTGLVRAAAAAATTWFAGADWQLGDRWRGWASRAMGMEPNRGATTTGEFLPPQLSRQSELGVKWNKEGWRVSGALWRITLDNVAMTDPADRTAIVAAGSRQVQGLELLAAWPFARWQATANATVQRTRHLVKTRPNLGERFVGVPKAIAGLQVHGPVTLPAGWMGKLAVSLTAVGSRMGDAANTVRVPGYVRVDGGLTVVDGSRQWLLGVRNLGDIRHVESVTAIDDVFQGARRQWWVGLRVGL